MGRNGAGVAMVMNSGRVCAVVLATMLSCGRPASPLASDAGTQQGIGDASAKSDVSAEASLTPIDVVPDGGSVLGDAFVPPSNPLLACEGGSTVSILLPCELGLGPIYELECKLDQGNRGFGFVLFPSGAPSLSPLDLTKLPASPTEGFSSKILEGTVDVVELHQADRTFLGTLSNLSLSVASDAGARICRLQTGTLWVVPGNFL